MVWQRKCGINLLVKKGDLNLDSENASNQEAHSWCELLKEPHAKFYLAGVVHAFEHLHSPVTGTRNYLQSVECPRQTRMYWVRASPSLGLPPLHWTSRAWKTNTWHVSILSGRLGKKIVFRGLAL